MSADQPDHEQASRRPVEFVVRPDGTVVGDDGAGGALAAALPYTGRLARRIGELVEAGDLRAMEVIGERRLTAVVTWTPAGEGTYRAVLHPSEPREVPTFTVVGAVDAESAVAHCLDRVMAVGGVRWSSIVTAGGRVLAASGEPEQVRHVAEVGNRMLAILRSLQDQHATGFIRLQLERGAVLGASLGRHALVAGAGVIRDEELVATIDEVRAVLADRDLTSVTTEHDPGAAPQPAPGPDRPVEPVTAPLAPPLVGARFAGAGERAPRKPRRRLRR